jgi:hypothetical protein
VGDARRPRPRAPPGSEHAAVLIHNFLGYVYAAGRTVHDGDVIDGPGGTFYRTLQRGFTRVTHGPFFNPFGVWHLARAKEDEQ